jgi:two-component system phosphate regulon sensor histidine kinase PhoR
MKLGINGKVGLLSVALVLLLVSFLSVYFIRQEKASLSSELDERGVLLLNSACTAVELPLLAENRDDVARVAEGALAQKDVVYCRVENTAGAVLFERGTPDANTTRSFVAPVVTRTVAETEGIFLGSSAETEEEIGRLQLGFSLAGLNRKVHDAANTAVVLAVITILLVSAASTRLFRFVLTKPIAALVAGTERIARGDLDYKVPVRMDDEIGHLARAFNKMTADMSKTLVSKKYVDNIIRSMSDCLVVTDPDGRIETVNRATVELFGYSHEELSGRPLAVLFDESSPVWLGIADSVSVARIDGAEIRCVSKAGVHIPVQFSSSPMFDEAGDVGGAVWVGQDITERKRTEEALAKQAETLAVANASLAKANAQLQQLDRLKSDFISNVSHELRTPLTAIKAYAETLQMHDSLTRAQRDSFLGIIVEQTDRLTNVIEDLLDISRIEAGKLKMTLEPINVQDAVNSAMENVVPLGKKKGVCVNAAPLPKERVVMADEHRLIQVLVNLLNNAVKFTGEGGVVTLSATAQDAKDAADEAYPAPEEAGNYATGSGAGANPRYLRLTVSDSGIGIPRAELAGIFDRFRQVEDGSRGKPSGTGLGLSICSELMSRMGGSIWAESEEGVGSRFHFTLPLAGEMHGGTPEAEPGSLEETPLEVRSDAPATA